MEICCSGPKEKILQADCIECLCYSCQSLLRVHKDRPRMSISVSRAMTEAMPRASYSHCTPQGPVCTEQGRIRCDPLLSVSLQQKHQLSRGIEGRGSFFQLHHKAFHLLVKKYSSWNKAETIIIIGKQTVPTMCQALF